MSALTGFLSGAPPARGAPKPLMMREAYLKGKVTLTSQQEDALQRIHVILGDAWTAIEKVLAEVPHDGGQRTAMADRLWDAKDTARRAFAIEGKLEMDHQ